MQFGGLQGLGFCGMNLRTEIPPLMEGVSVSMPTEVPTSGSSLKSQGINPPTSILTLKGSASYE